MRKRIYSLLAALFFGVCAASALEQDTDGYIKIYTAQDLIDFSAYVNDEKHDAWGKLMADIDLENVNFTPIGLYADDGAQRNFTGKFDGQGHVIRNLRVEISDGSEAGLFSRASNGATITNFGVVNATIINNGKRTNADHLGDPIRAGVIAGEMHVCNVSNLFTAGTIEIVTEHEQKGGISGEAANTTLHNCYTTYEFLTHNTYTPENCYAGAEVEELAPTGELCYMLNGDQTNIVFYQNLGDGADEFPVLDSTHKRVYANGELSCDGSPLGSVTYSNEETAVIPPHQYDDEGYCTVCGLEGYAVKPAADGWYEVTTPQELRWLSRFVNRGSNKINIRLMNDLDMTDIPNFPPMGKHRDNTWGLDEVNYGGTFDGQNFTISNLNIVVDDNYEAGFFGRVEGGTVKNVGFANATVVNNSTGPVRAGVVGGEIHNATVNNVWTTGNLSVTTEHQQCAGFAGEGASSSFTNCWSSYEGLFIGMNSTTLNNCLYYDENNYPNIAEECENGALCYKLNKNSFMNPTWYQTIGDDMYPVRDASHGLVYKSGEDTYESAVTAEDFAHLIASVIEAETEQWETTIVTRSLAEQYATSLAALAGLSFEEFKTAYNGLARQRTQLQRSAEAYALYQAKVAEVKARVESDNTIEGEARDVLVAYLNDKIEPNETYPHGSYSYIIELCELSTTDINTETNFVQFLLDLAISGGYTPGTDISSMITNAKFLNNVNGWTVTQAPTSVTATASAETTKSIVHFGFAPFEMKQTVKGLKEGLYEVQIGGYTEVSSGSASGTYNYVGEIFANGNSNLIKTQYSDLIAEDELYEAIAGNFAERFDYYGDPIGYAPGSIPGVSNAIDLGHFDNRILAYVKDDSITLGVRSDAIYNVSNASYFGNTRLFYLGSFEDEAAQAELDKVIDELVTMCTHMIEDAEPDIYEPSEATNFYEGLKEELRACINTASAATTPQEKYEAISKFAPVFPSIFSCKRAYSELMICSDRLIDAYGTLNPEEYDKVIVISDNATDIFLSGSATEEEVRALIDNIKADKYYQLHVGSKPEIVNGYYQIGNLAQLVWFREQVNGGNGALNAVLTDDIDLGIVEDFMPIGIHSDSNGDVGSHTYQGTFDGQGHVIRNLRVHRTDGSEAGFFSRTYNATIKNLGIENAEIINEDWNNQAWRAGIIAGEAHQSHVMNCFAVGNIYIETNHGTDHGLFGETASTDVTNCYTTYDQLTQAGTVKNCFVNVTEDELASGEFCYQINGDQSEIFFYQTLGEDLYPVPSSTHKQVFARGTLFCDGSPKDVAYANEEGAPLRDPHEFDEDGFCTVCGGDDGEVARSADGWYELATSHNLRWFGSFVNSGNTNVNARLTADIDMTGLVGYQPIGYYGDAGSVPYAGTFDGQGHVIKNFDFETEESIEAGIFGRVAGGAVKNLGVVNARVVNTNDDYGRRLAAVVGEAHNTTLTNIYVVGKIELASSDRQVNAIAGEAASGTLINCYALYPTLASAGTLRNCYGSEEIKNVDGTIRQHSVQGILATGELCYLLNEGNVETPAFFQHIGTDEYPVLSGDAVVYKLDDGSGYTNDRTNGAELAHLTEVGDKLAKSTKSYDRLITSASQLSTNCAWNDINTVDMLIDGDTDTHFHSVANTPGALTVQTGEEYIQVDFNKPVSAFWLEFSGRTDGRAGGYAWHDTPNQVTFKVSEVPEDEDSWEDVCTETYNVPNTHGVYYMATEPTDLGGEYTSVRMYILSVTSNNAYWNLSELQMYDTEESDTCYYKAVEGMKDAVDALDTLVAQYRDKLASDRASVTADDVKTLSDAIARVQALIDEADGIEQLATMPADAAQRVQGIYTLTGVRLSTTATKADLQRLPKGIYVINGRKALVK
ncbi:MAG: discoidin domain-containing protein [Bacteroidaceae bacterium]|nr:discoidin domain-containing protein [Bacteroidaceae bacterium]